MREIGTKGQLAAFQGRKQYSLTSFSMPFGIGFKYSISARFGISFEWGMRKTITDYLDDVSTTYYLDGDQIDPGNTAEVMSDPTFEHKPYQERGNPKTNDWYNFTGITLTYKFRLFGNKGCTDERRRVKY